MRISKYSEPKVLSGVMVSEGQGGTVSLERKEFQ